MDKKVVVIERTYHAPIEKVWEALTDKDQMKHWYFDVSDFKAEVGFEFQFSTERNGKQYLHKCEVVEATPITRVAYTWSYEGYAGRSLVTFELSSVDKEITRLKLTHSGLDTFSKDKSEFSPDSFNDGWENILGQSLTNFVETESFTKSIRINASSNDIWDIILNPDNQWGLAFGGGATAETDWKEGSTIIWKDSLNNIGANGIVEVHRPKAYLQLHYYDDVKPEPTAVPGKYYEKIRVVTEEEHCVLSIEIGRISRREVEAHQRMWDQAVNLIKELSEKKQTSPRRN